VTDNDPTIAGPLGHAVAHETLELMALYGVTPSPSNFEVWLAYRLGRNAELKLFVDERIAAGQVFTAEVCADLYERFFTGLRVSAQMVMAGEQIARDLSNVMAILNSVGLKNDEYGKQLETAAGTLETAIDPAQFREVVSSLAAATLDMATHNRSLSEQLQRSSREIDTLRANLESVRVESLTDGLTGLANRRMFDETIRLRIAEARNTRTELCLIMADIDHFKRFNDSWGHHTGDQVLRFVASVMRSVSQADQLVARFGGEEFAVLMPRTAAEAAMRTAETMRHTIQAKRLRRRSTDEDLGQVTVSIGVAHLKAGDTPQTLIERADACLYASKREGRNKVTVEHAPARFVA